MEPQTPPNKKMFLFWFFYKQEKKMCAGSLEEKLMLEHENKALTCMAFYISIPHTCPGRAISMKGQHN